MKKNAALMLSFIVAACASAQSFSDNIVRSSAPIEQARGVWNTYLSEYSQWEDVGEVSGCNWTPESSSVFSGESFFQTANNCFRTQKRMVQAREKNSLTNSIRPAGEAFYEQRLIRTSSTTRQTIGTAKSVTINFSSLYNKYFNSLYTRNFHTVAWGWQSTNQSDNSTGIVEFTPIFLKANTNVEFRWGVSSEPSFDKLKILVNGIVLVSESGQKSSTTTYKVPSDGNYSFSFTYTKDGSRSEGLDEGHVNSVTLTVP